jgi:hypothetical protein
MEILNKIWELLSNIAKNSKKPNEECCIYIGHEEWCRIMNCNSTSIDHMKQTIFGHRFYQVNELNHLEVVKLEK